MSKKAFAPLVEGNWKVVLNLKKEELKQFRSLEINGIEQEIHNKEDHIIFYGRSELNRPLRWKIKRS